MNYFSDEQDWKWLFNNAIEWDKIVPLYYPSFPTDDGIESEAELKEFFNDLVSSTGEWAGGAVTERAEALDQKGPGVVSEGTTQTGPELSSLITEATQLGAIGVSLPKEYGGMDAPATLMLFMMGQLSRACLASSTQLGFFTSIADMIDRFGKKEWKEKYIPQIIEGRISGAMCLTEPGCGSDLGMIQTQAVPQDDGSYLITGNKIFITNGGGGLHFALARIKGAEEGLDGLSLFFLEQKIEGKEGLNFQVVKNEHKIGMNGSFTTEIVYENSVGYLVGEEGTGLKLMLHLMNEARIAVGMQGLGCLEASYDYVANYAQERKQFERPIADLPLLKRHLKDFKTERDALRALMADTISHYDIFQRLDLKKRHEGEISEEEKGLYDRSWKWTRKRTPLVKFYTTEACTYWTQRGIQYLGGYGLMKEYPVERWHRDSFGPLLYEGTSQIQSLMALKDLLKSIMKAPGKFFSELMAKNPTFDVFTGKDPTLKEFDGMQYEFESKLLKLLVKCLSPDAEKIFQIKEWQTPERIEGLMVHAETICASLSYIETLRVLANHAQKDSSRRQLFDDYKELVTPRLQMHYSDWKIRG